MATGAARPSNAKRKGGLAETTRFLLLLLFFAVLLRTFVVAPFMIPSGSMMPELMIGDYLFVAKWPYGYSRYSVPFGLASFSGRIWAAEPERGDIVVFRYPGRDEEYVKRLIGLPGDTVQMRGGQLILNGKPVPKVRIADWLMSVTPNSPCRYGGAVRPPSVESGRPVCRYPRYRETLPGGRSYEVLDQVDGDADDTPVYSVPAGHYFMMGDNRDDSADSRFSLDRKGVGLLPRDYVVGRALIAFFSTDGSAEWLKPWTWASAARWERAGRTF
ncbi:MAG TPA: signal peptidase I [Allosphingosinicella sp.]|nr:signal peptidase I [Allosphingosinicella sp.]